MTSVDLVSLATPPLKVAEPMPVAPSRNFTFPVGKLGPADATVAVKVTGCPTVEGFGVEVSVVLVS
jgi:hypothetical protein